MEGATAMTVRNSVQEASRALALEQIARIMDGVEWDADTLDAIRDVLIAEGLEVREPEEVSPKCPKCGDADVRLCTREQHSYPYAEVRNGKVYAGHGDLEECEVYYWCPVCQEEVEIGMEVEWT